MAKFVPLVANVWLHRWLLVPFSAAFSVVYDITLRHRYDIIYCLLLDANLARTGGVSTADQPSVTGTEAIVVRENIQIADQCNIDDETAGDQRERSY